MNKIYKCCYSSMAGESTAVVIAKNKQDAKEAFIEHFDDLNKRYVQVEELGTTKKSCQLICSEENY